MASREKVVKSFATKKGKHRKDICVMVHNGVVLFSVRSYSNNQLTGACVNIPSLAAAEKKAQNDMKLASAIDSIHYRELGK